MVSPLSNSGMSSRMSGCSIERRMAPLLYFIIVSFPGGSTELVLGGDSEAGCRGLLGALRPRLVTRRAALRSTSASLGAHSLDILAQSPGSLQAPVHTPRARRSRMPISTSGLHHVTAIAGRAQANIEYYVRLLGQRLVKRTVNYDDPLTYHLYFGDALGNPGSILTFFPWPGAGPADRGSAEATAVTLRVPVGALAYWRDTLGFHGQEYREV